MKKKYSLLLSLFFISYLVLFFFDRSEGAGEGFVSERFRNDSLAVLRSRQAMTDIISYMDSRTDLFSVPENDQILLTRKQRLTVWQTWQSFLDHVLALDSMGKEYFSLYGNRTGREKKQAFCISLSVFLTQYRFSLDFIERAEGNAALHVILNEPVPELGLKEGTYSRLKFRFLNVVRGAEFASLDMLYRLYGKSYECPLIGGIDEDRAVLWEAGRGRGAVLPLKNALQIVQDTGFAAWFPVQKGVSQWMGDIKVWRSHESLISESQIKALIPEIEPGDILLERREWYLSNIGLPGFWTHTALYMGTPEERMRFFNDPHVKEWIELQGRSDGDFEKLLQGLYPESYRISTTPQEENHLPRIIEALSAGVSFTTLEHSARSDSLAVLRPNLPKVSKARAIMQGFHYGGRPYDFNFDFKTDSEIVCSELIYKVYEGGALQGLRLPLIEILGKSVTPPNEIARLFDSEFGSREQQFTFVLFLDGNEFSGRAVEAGNASFRKSWRRPKWHILTQEGTMGAGE